MKRVRLLLLSGSFALVGCVSKGDTNVGRGDDAGVAPATCNSICERLQAETFGDCKKWESYQDCIGECEDHRPLAEGLECMSNVADCDEMRACDLEFDIF